MSFKLPIETRETTANVFKLIIYYNCNYLLFMNVLIIISRLILYF